VLQFTERLALDDGAHRLDLVGRRISHNQGRAIPDKGGVTSPNRRLRSSFEI